MIYNYSENKKIFTFTIIIYFIALHIRLLRKLRAYRQIVNEKYFFRLLYIQTENLIFVNLFMKLLVSDFS